MMVFADDDNNMKSIKPLMPVMCRNAGVMVPLSLVKMGGRSKRRGRSRCGGGSDAGRCSSSAPSGTTGCCMASHVPERRG